MVSEQHNTYHHYDQLELLPLHAVNYRLLNWLYIPYTLLTLSLLLLLRADCLLFPSSRYHVVLTATPDSSVAPGGGNWFAWVNGVQVAWSGNVSRTAPGALWTSVQGAASVLNAVARPQSFLGKSDFSDGNAPVTIDAFRVYDYALTPALITSLASAYGLLNVATAPNASYPFPTNTAEDTRVNAALGTNKAPIFAASFATNPTAAVGGAISYQWNATDSTDASKTGVVTFTGASNSFIDLTTTTGPNSCGQLLPIFGGAGSGTFGVNQGVTFEMVVKVNAIGNWNKLFDFASAGGGDSENDIFGVSWQSNSGSVEIQSYTALNVSYTGNAQLSEKVFLSPAVGVWYHIALVLTNTDPLYYAQGNWQIYVNGINTTSAVGYNMPLPVQRLYSLLGAGPWSDAPASFSLDAFRIYDYTLTASTVQQLAAAYGLNSAAPGPSGASQEDALAAAAVPIQPVLSLSFSTNPTTVVGATNYAWVGNMSAQHQGVVTLTGSATSYVDLGTATGANSAGVVMPLIGGPGNFPYGNAQQGWTFEIVCMFTSSLGGGQWPKVFSLGSLFAQDEIILTFNGVDGTGVGAQIYSNVTRFPNFQYSFAEFLKPQPNTWYHIVWSVSAAPAVGAAANDYSASAGVWQIWVNGVLLNWAGLVNNGGTTTYPNSINTPVQGAGYPISIARPLSYLGKSDFSDNDLAMSVDAFRIYNYTLSTTSVQSLAAIYGLNIPNPQWPIPANQPVQAVTETAIWQNAALQAPVFNAVFGQNPAQYVGGTTSYTWMATDPSDNSSVAAYHNGIVMLNTTTSVVDVTLVTGPNSIGLALPIICTSTTGCSIELVVKLTQAMAWNKLINFGTGGYSDSLAITWYQDSTTVIVQQYNKCGSQGVSQNCSNQNLNIFTPVVGQWYSIALVMTPAGPTSNYNGTWTAYVNGQVAAVSQPLIVYPLPVYRQDSYIGGSDWEDLPIKANFDAVRVYNYPLSATEVNALAAKYNLAGPIAAPRASSSSSSTAGLSTAAVTSSARSSSSSSSTGGAPIPFTTSPSSSSSSSLSIPPTFVSSLPSSSSSSSSSSSAAAQPPITSSSGPGGVVDSSSSSSLSGGAIAGIVIGGVVGLALLALILCLLCGVGRRGKKSASSGSATPNQGTGGYSRSEDASEPSHVETHDVEMAEVHDE